MENETTPIITINVDLAAVQKLRQYFNERKFQHMAGEDHGVGHFSGRCRGAYGPCVIGSLLSDEDASGWDLRVEGKYRSLPGYALADCRREVCVKSQSEPEEVRRILVEAQTAHDGRNWPGLDSCIRELEAIVTV